MYTEVAAVTPDTIIEEFKRRFEALGAEKLALNYSQDDSRCDGLGLGLYRKLAEALGAERLAAMRVSSYEMLEELRAVKTPSEIAIMRECSRLTTDIYDALFERIHVGLSEIGVAKIMMEELSLIHI